MLALLSIIPAVHVISAYFVFWYTSLLVAITSHYSSPKHCRDVCIVIENTKSSLCIWGRYILDKQRNVIWPLSSINYSFPKVNVDSLRLYFPDFKHILYRELPKQFKPSILIHIDLMVGDQPVHARISIRLNKCQEKSVRIVNYLGKLVI